MQLRLARVIKGNKNNFYHYVDIKRLNKENVGSLQNGVGEFSDSGHSKAEVFNAAFDSIFTRKVSQGPVIS